MGSVVRCNQARKLDFVFHPLQTIKASCIFQRCCLVLIITLKGSHGIRTSCNVPRFAKMGQWGRDVRAAPAPVAGYIGVHRQRWSTSSCNNRSASAGGGALRTNSTSQRLRHWWSRSACAPVVEHIARAPRASTSSCGVRKWRSTPCQILFAAPAPVVSCVTPTWTKLSHLPRSAKSENQVAVSAVTDS